MTMKAVDIASVYHFRHSIEIDQQTQEDFIGSRAVFEDPVKIAEDGDTRNILTMESKNA